MTVIEDAWQSRGPLAVLLRPLAAIYGFVVRRRIARFRANATLVHRIDVPVVVVGNLVVGGAGKTPTVMAVATLLCDAGWRPGIVSRGYGRAGDGVVDVLPNTPAASCGDEPLLMRRRLGLPVVVGRDRVAACRHLRALHPQVDIILADDGLQHLRLGRDIEVIVFDERGVGNGWLLPAGPLREPFTPRRGLALVLYNAPAATTEWSGYVATRRLLGLRSIADWQAGLPASTDALASLVGRPLVAVAGTARPNRFFDMLRAVGLDVLPIPLPDHDPLRALPWPAGTPDVVVTEKDAVKLVGRATGGTRVWVAPLDFQPEPAFGEALVAALAALPATRRRDAFNQNKE